MKIKYVAQGTKPKEMASVWHFFRHYLTVNEHVMPPRADIEFNLELIESAEETGAADRQTTITQNAVAAQNARVGSLGALGNTSSGDSLVQMNSSLGKFGGALFLLGVVLVVVLGYVLKLMNQVTATVVMVIAGFFLGQFVLLHFAFLRAQQRSPMGLFSTLGLGLLVGGIAFIVHPFATGQASAHAAAAV